MSRDRWEVLVPETIDPAGPRSIEDVATVTSLGSYADGEAFVEDCDRFDAMIVRTVELSAEAIDAATALKVIAKHGAGLDNVDVEAASRNGVVVCNTPGANSRSVAEHAVMLLLATRRRVVEADAHVRGGGWDRHRFTTREVSGDTLGLLGFGEISRDVVALATGFEMAIATYDPYVPASELPRGVERVSTKRELFERADAVSVHVPLTEETRNAVSWAELEALGPGGVLVNASRGGVVDYRALLDALERGAVAGAGLDVFEPEPPSEDDPLLERPDVVLSPHVGGVTEGALERMSLRAAENVRAVYEGTLPDSTVNADALDGRR